MARKPQSSVRRPHESFFNLDAPRWRFSEMNLCVEIRKQRLVTAQIPGLWARGKSLTAPGEAYPKAVTTSRFHFILG
jgi:hypothetical protein